MGISPDKILAGPRGPGEISVKTLTTLTLILILTLVGLGCASTQGQNPRPAVTKPVLAPSNGSYAPATVQTAHQPSTTSQTDDEVGLVRDGVEVNSARINQNEDELGLVRDGVETNSARIGQLENGQPVASNSNSGRVPERYQGSSEPTSPVPDYGRGQLGRVGSPVSESQPTSRGRREPYRTTETVEEAETETVHDSGTSPEWDVKVTNTDLGSILSGGVGVEIGVRSGQPERTVTRSTTRSGRYNRETDVPEYDPPSRYGDGGGFSGGRRSSIIDRTR